MPTEAVLRHIHSGRTGTAGQSVSFVSTVQDFILLFQEDLKTLCTAFKSHLGIDIAYNRFVPRPGKSKFIMIRFAALSANSPARKTAYTFEIAVGRTGSQTAQTATPAEFSVEYSLERLVRLLQANGNLNRHAGISGLASIEAGIAPAQAFQIEGNNLEIASILVTYTRDETILYPSNH